MNKIKCVHIFSFCFLVNSLLKKNFFLFKQVTIVFGQESLPFKMTSLDDTIQNCFNSQRIQNVIIKKEETDVFFIVNHSSLQLEAILEQRREDYKKKFSQLDSAISKLNETNAELNETISKQNEKISMLQSDIHYSLIIRELLKRSR